MGLRHVEEDRLAGGDCREGLEQVFGDRLAVGKQGADLVADAAGANHAVTDQPAAFDGAQGCRAGWLIQLRRKAGRGAEKWSRS